MTPQEIKDKQFEDLVRKLGLDDVAEKAGLINPVDTVLNRIITQASEMLVIKDTVRKLAPAKIPVLILGETGTGKELIAQALHAGRKGKFVPVNCSGIPDSLLEAEFFGCVKGAYTGAYADRMGYVEEATEGTLFLDEIGDMPPLLQSKLLRLLQSRKYRRVGDVKERDSNFRLVSATNVKNLVCHQSFRRDLYYRLAGTTISLPELRHRVGDRELIIKEFAKEEYRERLINLTATMDFSGNVRELLNKIEEVNVLGL